jgi:hypothetical protein
MDCLILEGPDNIGKSTLIGKLEKYYRDKSLKVQVLRFPDRSDYPDTKGLINYYMGPSVATPLERQMFILSNSTMQYSKIDKSVDVLIFDRHPIISNRVYFNPENINGEAYRVLVESTTAKLAEIVDIKSTTCVILTGDHPFVDGSEDEFFETKWHEKRRLYDRLKYQDWLMDHKIVCCSIDVHEVLLAGGDRALIDLVDAAFKAGQKHVWGQSFLPVTIPGSIEERSKPVHEGVPSLEQNEEEGTPY